MDARNAGVLLQACWLAIRGRWSSAPLRATYSKRGLLDPRAHFLHRPFRTNQRCQNHGSEKLDLDVWKTMMKSQAAQKESESDGSLEAEASPLKASRELVEMWHCAGKLVPKEISDEQLEVLSGMLTKSAKKKYLKYLAIKEAHKTSRKNKQDLKKTERCVDSAMEAGESLPPKNTFLLRLWSRSEDTLNNWRMAQAMRFGQPLVYDLSYEQHMTRREIENTVSQLLESEGWNRRARDPFHLHFCNLQPDGAYYPELLKRYGRDVWERLLITATAEQHVERFPPEKLVYLTADSSNVLHRFDHNKVYIVGAMVDRSIHSGVSLANAKRLNLATARLPLDEHLEWGSGAKNLTLDQMIRILITAKETGSWQKALEFVPKRKHSGFNSDRRIATHSRPRICHELMDREDDLRKGRDGQFVSPQKATRSRVDEGFAAAFPKYGRGAQTFRKNVPRDTKNRFKQ